MIRRDFLAAAAAFVLTVPAPALAQSAPSAAQIERSLNAAPRMRISPDKRVDRRQFIRRPDLRRSAPSIEIQAINFAFASAEIPLSERHKVEQIAIAMRQLLRRSPREVFLIEGHTDAVGSHENNYRLSVRRAASLKRALVRYFGIPSDALETAGYGEDFLLVQTPYEEWRNRRVTLRRITDFVLR